MSKTHGTCLVAIVVLALLPPVAPSATPDHSATDELVKPFLKDKP